MQTRVSVREFSHEITIAPTAHMEALVQKQSSQLNKMHGYQEDKLINHFGAFYFKFVEK